MLDEAMILDQEQAVGLIENPCRDALIDLASKVPAGEAIVELGAFKGRSTGHLALGAQRGGGAHIWSVDPWEDAAPLDDEYLAHAASVAEYREPSTREHYERHLEATGVRPFVTTVQATAVEAAGSYDGPKVGLLFHDALHRKADVRDDLRAWLPHMADNAVIVLHDVGDPRFEVEEGARLALGRRKAWDWEGREIRLWQKPDGQGGWRTLSKRGFAIIRTR